MDLFEFVKIVVESSAERFGCIKALPMYICTDGKTAYILDDVEIGAEGCVFLLRSEVPEGDTNG